MVRKTSECRDTGYAALGCLRPTAQMPVGSCGGGSVAWLPWRRFWRGVRGGGFQVRFRGGGFHRGFGGRGIGSGLASAASARRLRGRRLPGLITVR